MIISASRRTDIPAFYSRWFMTRLRAGYCVVPNPYNPRQRARVSLAPSAVDALVFWSKDPRPLLEHLDELEGRGLRTLFQFTLNAYGPELEPGVPPLAARLECFAALAARLGPRRILWRYDPILLSSRTPPAFHQDAFARLAGALAGRTRRVVISLIDFYRKTRRNLAPLEARGLVPATPAEARAQIPGLLETLRDTARQAGLEIQTCAEAPGFAALGLAPGSCVDGRLIADLWGVPITAPKDPHQRPACLCAVSRDIGVGDTCLHGCLYCYATNSAAVAARRHRAHDPDAEALWG